MSIYFNIQICGERKIHVFVLNFMTGGKLLALNSGKETVTAYTFTYTDKT